MKINTPYTNSWAVAIADQRASRYKATLLNETSKIARASFREKKYSKVSRKKRSRYKLLALLSQTPNSALLSLLRALLSQSSFEEPTLSQSSSEISLLSEILKKIKYQLTNKTTQIKL